MKYIGFLIAAAVLFTGCGTRGPTEADRKEKQERAAKEEQEEAIHRVEGEMRLKAMENSRSIRERAYCAPSPEVLGSLYGFLKAGDSERASAVAELTGAEVLDAKTKILVLNVRPFYKGIGASLVRVARTGRACYVANTALKTD